MRIKYRDVSFASVAIVFNGCPDALLLKSLIREQGTIAALVDALRYYRDKELELVVYEGTCNKLRNLIATWPAEVEENRVQYPKPKQFFEGQGLCKEIPLPGGVMPAQATNW